MSTLQQKELISVLPYARRYARALTGNQIYGDKLVAECLQILVSNKNKDHFSPRETLYYLLTKRFNQLQEKLPSQANRPGLTSVQRQLLLLTSLEEQPISLAAAITGLSPNRANELIFDAREKLHHAASTSVLIIEDEPIIAMDIEDLVRKCGHTSVGIAGTEDEATMLAITKKPGLILADINLGLGGDGMLAVERILKHHPVPVIFVTAYPERLLTGSRQEPCFVITKPFEPLTLAVATYQAVTGGLDTELYSTQHDFEGRA
ncbi:response regulator [Entomobacter blattae]|uniref:Phyllosphere-induced regulator PhyR n=1 Tax=Entomobacter blattae TaxID=2762277 RepID=A0A7H1NS26_9PROT|nr:response regulator [Entomobacter blattae]QNT78586.1 Phyllosphere-induced regulator PhyR [Entomobacter blattae]